MNPFEYEVRDLFPVVMMTVGVLCFYGHAVHRDWVKPSTWRREAAWLWFSAKFSAILCVAFYGLGFLLVYTGANAATDHANAMVAFQTGLVESLEKVAHVGGGGTAPMRDGEGSHGDGSRYKLLADEAGPVVRVDSLTGTACVGAMSGLSGYARANLRVQDGRSDGASWHALGTVEKTCSGQGAVGNLTFRASAVSAR
jgi:hypothetical protein